MNIHSRADHYKKNGRKNICYGLHALFNELELIGIGKNESGRKSTYDGRKPDGARQLGIRFVT